MARVLLVEDNELNWDMLSRRLMRRGWDVILAHDGEIGIRKAQVDHPDIVLMDLSIPVIDGWTSIRCLKSDDCTRHIPVIALSAHAMELEREKAFASGVDAYVTKPVDFPLLLREMNRLLNGLKDAA